MIFPYLFWLNSQANKCVTGDLCTRPSWDYQNDAVTVG